MEREEFLDAKRHQIELVLLGVLLAGNGARYDVMGKLRQGDFSREKNGNCFTAMKNQDVNLVRTYFRTLGVKIKDGETVIDSLVNQVVNQKQNDVARERLSLILASFNVNDDVNVIRQKIQGAIEAIDDVRKPEPEESTDD